MSVIFTKNARAAKTAKQEAHILFALFAVFAFFFVASLHQTRIAAGQRLDELRLKVIAVSGDARRDALLIQRSRPRDLAGESRAQVAIATAGRDVRLVIELDLANEQAR